MREAAIEYILTQIPKEFSGKENWLGVKLTPHTPMRFINKVVLEGVETNEGFISWLDCNQETISTIYQRLKLIELYDRAKANH